MRSRLTTRRALLAAAVLGLSVATYVLAPSPGDRASSPATPDGPAVDGAVRVAPLCAEATGAADHDADGDRAPVRFGVIGDYGINSAGERRVASLINSWSSDFVITTGDNNYPLGAAETIDVNIGQFFHELIGGYSGRFGCGAARNRFFPALGNHDLYTDHGRPYLDYFQLPGNERYYDFVRGAVHLFAIDSDPGEPDGNTAQSKQAAWLKARLAASKARWQVVYMHHPPRSSGPHGSTRALQWPYAAWGADLVLAGHDHDYERIEADGITYVVNGLGGAESYDLQTPVPGSVARHTGSFGAMLVEASVTRMSVRFYDVDGTVIDDFQLGS